MKRALVIAALVCASCAQQDAALLVTMSGAFLVPQSADRVTLDVYDGSVVIRHGDWPLSPQPAFAASVTVVESGAAHPHVKLNVELFKGTSVVGLGSATADFHDGETAEISIPVTPP